MDSPQATLNIPSLLAFALLSFLAIRYFFFSRSSGSTTTTSNTTLPPQSHRPSPATPARIDSIAAMFPQLDRRSIEWDLLRNGGSVTATTERVLRHGRLGTPPPTFCATPAPSAPAQPAQQRTRHADLITRYGLAGRIDETPEAVSSNGWSASKTERAASLKHRREEMVLAARRKMQERDAQKT